MSASSGPWMISGGGTALAVGLVVLIAGLVGFVGGDRSEGNIVLAAVGATLLFAGVSFLRFGLAASGAMRKAAGGGRDEVATAPPPPGGKPAPAPTAPPSGARPAAAAARSPSIEEERLVICAGCGYQELASRGHCEMCGTPLPP